MKMTYSFFVVVVLGFLGIGRGSISPENEGNDIHVLLKQRTTVTCRSALSQCIKDLDNGKRKECEILPVPPRSFLKEVAQGTFELQKLRSEVWLYSDGLYSSLILKKDKRLALIDFPNSAASNIDTGSGTLLTDAIEQVLGETKTIPARIDMVYSHAHFDHIGASKRVFNYAKAKFPDARFFVWGTQETKDLIEVHTTNRAVKVNMMIRERGRTLTLGPDLSVKMMIVGGHTQQDLVIFIPKRAGQKGIAYYVDVVLPRWSIPFNLAVTQDMRDMINAQKEILKLNFDILVPGHIRLGTKQDMKVNVAYLEDLLATGVKVLDSISPEQLTEAGIGKLQDPNAREYKNVLYGFFLTRNLEIDVCYRAMIEKWGCRFAALDVFLRGHCFVAITFALTDI